MVSRQLEPDLSQRVELDRLLADDAFRHAMFPVTRDRRYFAHAAVSPLPTKVCEAITAYLERASAAGQFQHLHSDIEMETRELAAQLMGVGAHEVAFAPSTSAGLSMIANGLDLGAGDSVVVYGGDFPSNVLPWLALRRAGVEVRVIERNVAGVVSVEEVLALVDDTTRLVAVSSAHYCTGVLLPLQTLAPALAARGVLLCVDAIQTLGSVDMPLGAADFAVADAHKWLLGPQGVAVLYVRAGVQDRLRPTLLGWKSMADPDDFRNLPLELASDARRYEPGSLNVLGLVGLHAALQLLTAVGIDGVWQRIAELNAAIESGLIDLGCELLISGERELRGPMRAFVPRRPVREVAAYLDARQCIVSVRPTTTGGECLRVAPHFYNTRNEVDVLLTRVSEAERGY